ncbi:MAG: anthranilate synthase component II [Chitinivibrionales bacterium]
MILMIDNYDSFTYNLVQYINEFEDRVEVFRNDALSVEDVRDLSPDGIVISPGPSVPENAGISKDVIAGLCRDIPILGVCLGHQAISEVFGGRIVRAPYLMHGKTSLIHHDSGGVLKGIETPCTATRYHSLIVEKQSLPKDLRITAWTEDGVIMGVTHTRYPVYGIQFHPESILTQQGMSIIENFYNICLKNIETNDS